MHTETMHATAFEPAARLAGDACTCRTRLLHAACRVRDGTRRQDGRANVLLPQRMTPTVKRRAFHHIYYYMQVGRQPRETTITYATGGIDVRKSNSPCDRRSIASRRSIFRPFEPPPPFYYVRKSTDYFFTFLIDVFDLFFFFLFPFLFILHIRRAAANHAHGERRDVGGVLVFIFIFLSFLLFQGLYYKLYELARKMIVREKFR